MNLNENKGAKIAGIGGALVVATTVILNLTGILDWLGISPKSAPEETSTVSYEVAETVPVEVIEQQNIAEKVTVPVTEAPTEPPPTEPPVVYLDSLEVTDSNYYFENIDSDEDTIGNIYLSHVLRIGRSGHDDTIDYAIYYLGGKYKTLSGTIAFSKATEYDHSGHVAILSDDNLIYNTEEMGKVSTPVEFSVSVENCQWLKISKTGQWACFILYNWRLE